MANKRHAASAPMGDARKEKKQKTTIRATPQRGPAPLLSTRPPDNRSYHSQKQKRAEPRRTGVDDVATVVPVTPGSRVTLSGAKRGSYASSVTDDGGDDQTGVPSGREGERQDQRGQGRRRQKQPRHEQQQKQPSTLPLEPHAALLTDLQPKYDVRVLSVISSSRMEKRIKAILEQLGREPQGAGASEPAKSQTSPYPHTSINPGVVMLHARAPDASKMISIVEIVKRRIREGYFATDASAAGATVTAAAKDTKKQKKKQKQVSGAPAQIAWFQYNRLYDVESEVQAPPPDGNKSNRGSHGASSEGEEKDDDDDGDDGFEPMPQRLREAMAGAEVPTATSITTYMSIFLSRVSIPELERNPEFTTQASTDPLEVEYLQWMNKQ